MNKLSFNSLDEQNLVRKLQNYINNNYYMCTNELLLNLGNMYVIDEQFTNNIDKFGEGTANFVNMAIKYYYKKKIKWVF